MKLPTDPYRELFIAELAVVMEVASARNVADAAQDYLRRREELDASLSDRLLEIGGVTPGDLSRIEAEVDRLISESAGDSRAALASYGQPMHTLDHAWTQVEGTRRDQTGAGIVNLLRPAAKDRYETLGLLGEGGMGRVVLARDRELARRVALKTMRTPNHPDQVEARARRFLREAQITGALDHPGIVPIHEMGTVRDGVPYYTMRVVSGRNTLEDAIGAASTPSARMDLLDRFLRACDAVEYAHSRGVLHCDLKPANVALGEYGETIVLDWGLACTLAEASERSTIHVGTPGYAAPEAFVPELGDVSERSDVYSLGAMLRHLLTGLPPHQPASAEEYRASIRAPKEPARAPTDAPEGVEQLLQVCARATALQPKDRMDSVEAFALSLRRVIKQDSTSREVNSLCDRAQQCLDGVSESSTANKGRLLDRAAGFVAQAEALRPDTFPAHSIRQSIRAARDEMARRRDRVSRVRTWKRVGMVALVLVAVTSVTFAGILENRRAETESARKEATDERDRAEDLSSFLLTDLYTRLEELDRLDLLSTAARKVRDHYRTRAEGSASSRLSYAESLGRVGNILDREGSSAEAAEAHRRSLDMFAVLHRAAPANLALTASYVVRLREAARCLDRAGDVQGAASAVDRAVGLAREIVKANEDLEHKHDLANALSAYALHKYRHDDLAAAGRAYDECVELLRNTLNEGVDKHNQSAFAMALAQRAAVHRKQGKLAEAIASLEESRSVLETTLDKQRTTDLALARVHRQLVDLCTAHNEVAKAHHHLESALSIFRAHALANPRDLAALDELGQLLLNAVRIHDVNQSDAPWKPAREAVKIYEKITTIDGTNLKWQNQLARAVEMLGDLHRTREQASQAFVHFDRSVRVRRRLHENNPSPTTVHGLASSIMYLARGTSDLKQFQKSLPLYREAETLFADILAATPSNHVVLEQRSFNAYWFGDALRLGGKLEEARAQYLVALNLTKKAAAASPTQTRFQSNLSEIHAWLGDTARLANRLDEALTHYTSARDAARVLCNQPKPTWQAQQALARAIALRGMVLEQKHQYVQALASYRKAAALNQEIGKLNRRFIGYQRWYDGQVAKCELLAGERKPSNPREYATAGMAAHRSARHADAVTLLSEAFKSERLLASDTLLLSAIRSAAKFPPRHDQAFQWLDVLVRRWRATQNKLNNMAKSSTDETRRKKLEAGRNKTTKKLGDLRDLDPALEDIRGHERFMKVFEAK